MPRKKSSIQRSDASFLLYQTEDGKHRIQVRQDEGSIWMSQAQLVELYQSSKQNISLHLKNIFRQHELLEDSVVKENLTTASDGKRYKVKLYRLEAILAIGYRVNSVRGTQFRQWATQVLGEYAEKGFALDDDRLKNPPSPGSPFGDPFQGLLERIRDIRASEKRLYLRVREIFSLAADYVPSDEQCIQFFAIIQNKLHFAVTGKTAAELIAERADHRLPNMGLSTWQGARVLGSDVKVAKNYLREGEITELNRIVSMWLDFAEDQATRKKQVFLKDWERKLADFLRFNEREVLDHTGQTSKEAAEAQAFAEYEIFAAQERARLEEQGYADSFGTLEKIAQSPSIQASTSGPKSAPPTLAAAFLATHYRVSEHPHNFVIRIGEASKPVEAMFWDYSLASAIYITAYNPFSVKKPDAVNEAANAKLRQRLEALGAVAIFEGEGKDPDPQATWPGEASFLALGLDEKTGQALAQEFGQWAFVFIEQGKPAKLVWNAKKP